MNDRNYLEANFGEYRIELNLDNFQVKSRFYSGQPGAIAQAFEPDGNLPPPEVQLFGRALHFAAHAHGAIKQKRKYSDRPYIVHPFAVAEIVRTVPHTPEMLAAALLHDVLEDTLVKMPAIRTEFGDEVSDLVFWLTDVSRPHHGNRAKRKELDRKHIAAAPSVAQTIKAADLIDNGEDIREHDPDFWKVYRREMQRLLEVLTGAHPDLLARAWQQCQ